MTPDAVGGPVGEPVNRVLAPPTGGAGYAGRTAWVAVGLLAFGGSNFAFLAFAARDLGDARSAPLGVAWTVLNAIGIGLFQPLEQEAGRRLAARRAVAGEARADLRHLVRLALAACATCAVVGLALLGPIADLVFHDRRDMVVVLVLGLVGQAVAYLARGVLAGSGRFPRYGLQLLADGVLRTAGAGVLFAVGSGAGAYGAVLVVAPVIATLVAISPRAVAHAVTGPVAGVGRRDGMGALVAASATGQVLANVGPIAMAVLAADDQQALSGRFVYAVTIARIPLFLFAAVQAVFLPSLAALLARRDASGFARSMRRATLATAALGGVGVLGVWLLGTWLMDLVYGFHLDAGLLALIAASAALFMLAQVAAQGLLAHHADAVVALGWSVGLIATVAALALPGDLATRVGAALCVGSAVAAAAHSVSLQVVHRAWRGEPRTTPPTDERAAP